MDTVAKRLRELHEQQDREKAGKFKRYLLVARWMFFSACWVLPLIVRDLAMVYIR